MDANHTIEGLYYLSNTLVLEGGSNVIGMLIHRSSLNECSSEKALLLTHNTFIQGGQQPPFPELSQHKHR